jgi:anti-sigma regulatory factor (Ser/Thr protein kinase)
LGGVVRDKETAMTTAGSLRLELSLPALPASARRARAAVAETVAELGIDERRVDDVRLCVSEAVTNAVVHAYGSESGTVDVTVVARDPGVVVVVRDFGSGLMGLHRDGGRGFGLSIIDAVSDQCALSSVSGVGTEVSMAFGTTLTSGKGQLLAI